MECFHTLIHRAESRGLLQELGRNNFHFRALFYAGDVVFLSFFSPVELDLRVVKGVLSLFEKASDLAANYTNSHVYLINYSEEPISMVLSILYCSIIDLPCTYLGVLLSNTRIPKDTLKSLVNKITRRLPPWQGRLLNWSGHLILAKATLSAVPMHISMAIVNAS